MLRVLLAFLLTAYASGAEADSQAGQYFCFRSFVGGVSFKEGKPVGAGPITFPQERYRFFITIEPIHRDEHDISFCKESAGAFFDLLEHGGSYQDFDRNVSNVQSRGFLGWSCFTKDRLLLKLRGSERTQEFRAYDLEYEFYGLTPPDLFRFSRITVSNWSNSLTAVR
jgi:hypothetical protein